MVLDILYLQSLVWLQWCWIFCICRVECGCNGAGYFVFVEWTVAVMEQDILQTCQDHPKAQARIGIVMQTMLVDNGKRIWYLYILPF